MLKRKLVNPLIFKVIDYFLKQPIGLKYLDYVLDQRAAEKKIFQNFIPNHLDRVVRLVMSLTHMTECYSQEGEDLFLIRIFGTNYKGFYIDIGSHHPRRFSNTYLLYKLGWRGINIDATPNSMVDFSILRANDINIECAITNDSEPRPFFLFVEGALNTFSERVAQDYMDLGYTLDRREVIIGQSLSSILDKHLERGQVIDVLSVDVEGDEYGILQSNDWSRYRPNIVLIEILGVPLAAIAETSVASLLLREGYIIMAKFTNTVVFKLEKKN